jgi:hypothetical protein
VFAALPVESLAAAACVSRRFAWLSARVLRATTAATLVLRPRALDAPHRAPASLAGLLRAAPALRCLTLAAAPGAPLSDALCVALARAAHAGSLAAISDAPASASSASPPACFPAQLGSITLTVAPCGGENGVTGAGVAALAGAAGIHTLVVEAAAGVSSLALRAPSLRRFALRGACGLRHVSMACPALEALTLELAPATAAAPLVPTRAARALAAAASFDAAGDAAATLARAALAGCPALRVLRFAAPRCGDAVASALASAAAASPHYGAPSLRTLSLPFCGAYLSDAGVAALAAACPALEALDLGGASALSDTSLRVLVDAYGHTLCRLTLPGCPGLSREGIACAISGLRRLETLDLAHTLVAQSGVGHACGDADADADADAPLLPLPLGLRSPAAFTSTRGGIAIASPVKKRHASFAAAAPAAAGAAVGSAQGSTGPLCIASASLRVLSLQGCSAVAALSAECPRLAALQLAACGALQTVALPRCGALRGVCADGARAGAAGRAAAAAAAAGAASCGHGEAAFAEALADANAAW